MLTLFLKLAKIQQRENCKFVDFNHPTPVWWVLREKPSDIYNLFTLPKISILGLHFCRLSSFVSMQWVFRNHMHKCYVSCNMARNGRSRSSKVINFCTNWKPVCDFLLVFSSNLGPILHRFGDTTLYVPYLWPFNFHARSRSLGYNRKNGNINFPLPINGKNTPIMVAKN